MIVGQKNMGSESLARIIGAEILNIDLKAISAIVDKHSVPKEYREDWGTFFEMYYSDIENSYNYLTPAEQTTKYNLARDLKNTYQHN